MTCPFLEEILMVYCRAYPVKKPLPKMPMTTACPCVGEGYQNCSFFQELMTRAERISRTELITIGKESRKGVT